MTTCIRTLAAALLVLAASQAQAFPAFARKYGLSCSACHEAWPILNQVGQNFRDNGYQFGLDKDDPVEHSPDYLPIALRTTPAYQYTRTTNQPSDAGAVTTVVGGVPVPPGVDLLTGGAISPDVSWLLVLSGFSPSDGQVAAESAWVRLNHLAGSTFANLRVGKFELDLPVSPHRGIALTYGYPIYGGHPQGSLVPLDMNENQEGIELDGHDARSLFRYSLSLTSMNEGEGLSKGAWSTPLAYCHIQKTFELENRFLPRVRVGVNGAVGSFPTVWATNGTDADGNPIPVPGTGTHPKSFSRVGAEAAVTLGQEQKPLIVTAVYMHGQDNAGLSSGADPVSGEDLSKRAGTFDGGFVEADWVPVVSDRYAATPWAIFGRYDVVRYAHAVGDVDGYTLGVRRYLVLGPRASAAIHVEGHYDKTRRSSEVSGANGIPLDVETQSVLAGIDFDF